MNETTTYVLVHGSGLGGWCWNRVKHFMELHGAKVYTPSIPETCQSLESYITYIFDLIESENLQNCILVGHSYGGMVVTGVADRLKHRIQRVIFLDAAVPKDGDDFASHIPGISGDHAERRRQAFRSFSKDGVWMEPISPELAGISDQEEIDRVNKHSCPYPLKTWIEPIKLKHGGLRDIEKTYILAIDPPSDIMGYPAHGAIAKNSDDWTYREIHCGHAAMIIEPDVVASLLLE